MKTPWVSRIRNFAFVLFSIGLFVVPAARIHAQNGLVALYTFKEGSGTNVIDVSGVGTPLNLVIPNPPAVRWLPGGGISIDSPVLIASPGPATKIIQAAMESNELTVEAWVKPHNLSQSGPARVVTVSLNAVNRNFTFGQNGTPAGVDGFWIMRTRTPLSGLNGSAANSQFNMQPGTTQQRLQHIVYTRDAFGTDTFYIDGVLVEQRADFPGDFSNWNATYRLGLAQELDGTSTSPSRAWLGEIHKVAIYNRALTPEEVAAIADVLVPKLEVADATPARGTLFHPAASGLRFRAVALADNTIAQSDVQLTLNGQNRSSELQFTGTNKDWQVTFAGLQPNQQYTGEISIKDNSDRTRVFALDFATFTLSDDGLVALYTFEEGSGTVIRDRSESGLPLDLTIGDASLVRWVPGGGLAVDAPVRIISGELAEKIRQPIKDSGALTLEAWIRSAGTPTGSARIVTASEFRINFPGTEAENSLRNFTLAQEGSTYQFYLRTSETDEAGRPPTETAELPILLPTHVVFTREAGGQARLYLNGAEVVSQAVAGNLSNWFEYRLSLGGELNEVTQAPADHRFRSWVGEFYRVAIYRRALTAQQVGDNYRQFAIGNDTTAPTMPQNLTVRAGAVFTELSWGASTDDSGRVFYEVQRNGQSIATFLTTTSYVDQAVTPSTSYSYQVRAIDLTRNASAFTATVSGNTKALAPVTGVVKAEFYTGITGTLVDELRLSEKFPNAPDSTSFFPAVELPVNANNNYGARVTGWFVAPQTDSYVFFLCSDDQGELRLSSDATEGNLKLIAMEPQRNAFRAWTAITRRDPAFPENRSDTFLGTEWTTFDPDTGGALINLQGGSRYYFEALMKEGTGGDNLAVTYKLKGEPDPAAGTPSRLRGNAIQTMADPDFVLPVVKTAPQSQGVAFGQSVTLDVEMAEFSSPPFTYQWRFGGNAIPGATGAIYTIPSFQLQNVGYYTVMVSSVAGTAISGTAYLRPLGSGLLALYTFAEGSGTTVRDVSDAGSPLNLEINEPGAVRWLPTRGLAVDVPNVVIASAGSATKVIDGVVASGELTVEVWATPADLTLIGPARFVTVSASTGLRNFTLGQDLETYQFRFRTSATDANAGPVSFYLTSPSMVQTQLTHIVYTRNVDGLARMYINGVEVAQNTTVVGTTATWDPSFRLGLANELTGDRGWVGEFHRVALYSYALPATEVTANFQAGPNPTPPVTLQPVTLSNVNRTANTVRFDFPTVTGRRYVVEYKNELSAGPWTELQTINGDGTVQSAVDSNASSGTRFYRVRTE